jgi:hypothetical protein
MMGFTKLLMAIFVLKKLDPTLPWFWITLGVR